MGGIQRRRRRLRHHHPVVEPTVGPADETAGDAPGESAGESARGKASTEASTEAGGPVGDTAGEVAAPAVAERPMAPAPKPAPPRAKPQPPHAPHPPHPPSPHDLAELSGAFAMTANVADPEPESEPAYQPPHHPLGNHDHEDVVTERGLRGLVGGGASQVSVAAAMRARDAARPTETDLAAADEDLVIVRRGWVPREELPRPGRR